MDYLDEVENRTKHVKKSMSSKENLLYGIKKGFPLFLGYFPVAVAFGLTSVSLGIPLWLTIAMSLTNFTSAGQFSGVNLISTHAYMFEVAVTTFIINLRYLLMSISTSQKLLDMKMPKKLLVAFGITDETFAISSTEKENHSFLYFMGLIACPYVGWALGTIAGAFISSNLPVRIQNSMDIMLYAMFIAIISPEMKKSKPVLITILVSIGISSLFKWTPILSEVSKGFIIIITTIAASAFAALIFPIKDETDGN